MNNKTPVLLTYAFRPFFVLAPMIAILTVLLWVMTLQGSGLSGISPFWHSHELLIGFAMATVAGFSLTAVANWTSRPAIHGAPLAWLISLWLAGRFAMLLTAWLPAGLVAMLDILFPVLLCILLGREIIAGNSKRNYVLILIIGIVALLNGLYHLGTTQILPGVERPAIYLLIHSVLVLVAIIAARIVPAFTGNWLRMQGKSRLPVNNETVNTLALWLTITVGLAASLLPTHPVTGGLALITAIVHAFRLSRWRGLSTISNPLLFVLHAAYAWLPLGYALLACSVFGWLFTPTAALHALTMGAIGTTVLAVISRVALGHTGRPLQVARATVLAYWLLMIAVWIRVLGPMTGEHYLLMINLSALGWISAFAIFLWVYWPILTRQRVS